MKAKANNKQAKLWLKKETSPYGKNVLFLTILSTFSTIFAIAFAYLVRYLINSASSGDKKLLWIFAAVLLGVLFFKILLKTLHGYFAERLRTKMYANLRRKTFTQILQSD